ncbi:MAG: 5-oxoprolinase subunit PxpB [Anaerolineales bacterium]|nr:5-oxoprolinase subunit PxpB [Anaerolineales bacterium]MCX7756657.1 5-oxoprolinase subunit PxpB [Anaerolineales bacterium]MDW8277268.1 5-oxoprolinase subunit PxpB [Anaerolineales bacterium]
MSRPAARIFTLSDTALLIRLGEVLDPALNRRVHLLAAALKAAPLPGFLECVPGYASLTVHYDPLALTESEVRTWLKTRLHLVEETAQRPTQTIEVPVVYNGPDLDFVAETCHLAPDEVIRLHCGTRYTVYMMGFTPGFPYLGILPEALRVPRLPTPRARVPAGSVAIAGAQTGIYPVESPGGWRLIGHTPLTLFDPNRTPPFLFAPGDEVRFLPGNMA